MGLSSPRQSFNASVAWRLPTMPAIGPRMPASWHDGTAPAGGAVRTTHR
jgi:hypothetical protein